MKRITFTNMCLLGLILILAIPAMAEVGGSANTTEGQGKTNYTMVAFLDNLFKKAKESKKQSVKTIILDKTPVVERTYEPIEPFGDFKWDDGLYEIVEKLNRIDGLEEMDLYLARASVDLKGIKSRSELASKLEALIKKKGLNDPTPKSTMNSNYLHEYTDLKGQRKYYVIMNLYIYASPIIIAGVPFKMNIRMEASPGLAVQEKSEKALFVNDGKIAFASSITQLGLGSNSLVLADKHRDLDALTIEKFKKYNLVDGTYTKGNDIQDYLSYRDSGEGRIMVQSKPTGYGITYMSEAFKWEMDSAYDKHLIKLEEEKLRKKNAGKEDMSSGL